jgi:GPH family glycoside/pentoside/hexuronide:cation symporter
LVALLLGLAGFVSGTDPVTGQTVVNITNYGTVKDMIWALFSLFPALIVVIMLLLLYKYPIKK